MFKDSIMAALYAAEIGLLGYFDFVTFEVTLPTKLVGKYLGQYLQIHACTKNHCMAEIDTLASKPTVGTHKSATF